MKKLKQKHLEIVAVYLLLCLLVHLLSVGDIISVPNMERYEVILVGMAFYLIVIKILAHKKWFKFCIKLSQLVSISLCIALYYSATLVGFIIFVVCEYTAINVAIISFDDLKGEEDERKIK